METVEPSPISVATRSDDLYPINKNYDIADSCNKYKRKREKSLNHVGLSGCPGRPSGRGGGGGGTCREVCSIINAPDFSLNAPQRLSAWKLC